MPAARPATTTVRVHADGDLGPHRRSAQGRSCTTADDYLGHLTKRCPDRRQLSCPLPPAPPAPVARAVLRERGGGGCLLGLPRLPWGKSGESPALTRNGVHGTAIQGCRASPIACGGVSTR